jgi:hypothetical protein
MAIVDADIPKTDGEYRLWVCLGLSYARSLPTKENPSLPPERSAALGATHPLAGSGVHRLIPTQMGRSALIAAEQVPYEVSASHVIHGSTRQVAETLAGHEGLEHVVLWDVTPQRGSIRPAGGRLWGHASNSRSSCASPG